MKIQPLTEAMINTLQESQRTISDHYGVKHEDFDNWCDDMLCDIIKLKTKSAVLDKWFPNISGEERCKIIAFAQANDLYYKMSE